MTAATNPSKQVLVVCTGNTCRSPMAAAWLAKKLESKGWTVGSAGVAAWNGQPASPEAVEAMREIGVDLADHRSRIVDDTLVAAADIILTMTEGHRYEINARFPQATDKVHLVKSFGAATPGNVMDPIGAPLEVYRQVRDELVQALDDFLVFLAERGELPPAP